MTTNQDQVRGWLAAAINGEIPAEDLDQVMENMTRNGLIAPDLPPYEVEDQGGHYWYVSTLTIGSYRKFVTFQDTEPGGVLYLDPDTARDFANKFNAAAQDVEERSNDRNN
ncbi:hypothetical protein [Corynebacterium sp.]|uniref:hypothetical protein n=1 Tax=Corynebacterium sp. TaxID=1720 RepID=UPI0028A78B72|nr:hypothetical protein [Corynebacterium sp.]